jgi:sulfur carrier protein ThiS
MLPVIMALGAMATLAIAMSGVGGGAEGEVMEVKSTSIEDKLDALTAAILAQPVVVTMDGKVVGKSIAMSKTQTTIDMA